MNLNTRIKNSLHISFLPFGSLVKAGGHDRYLKLRLRVGEAHLGILEVSAGDKWAFGQRGSGVYHEADSSSPRKLHVAMSSQSKLNAGIALLQSVVLENCRSEPTIQLRVNPGCFAV